ncbi:Abi-alpha family protein [Roseateles sp. MS654]|uniref:Abi-alpha family protein n=1 Tax=Roseateles sp. MS654 TaxID=3412685 RepID=UPI003C2EF351
MDEREITELVAPVAKEAYSDAVAPAMRELGKLGADAVKVGRLVLFPLQYGAWLQDRLARRLSDALERVPESRRIAPRESIALPVAERLRHEDDSPNPIAQMYVKLLSRAMDKERVGDAHPAFVHIIGQLAPDEVLVIGQLAEQPFRAFLRLGPYAPALTFAEASARLSSSAMEKSAYGTLLQRAVHPEQLAQPPLFLTFVEHLQSLGLVEYTNEPRDASYTYDFFGFEYHYIKLTHFGRLFHRACVDDDFGPASQSAVTEI